MSRDSALFAQAVGHHFANSDLLTHALTHCSAGGTHNERMEFLGDALLGYIIAETLYHRFPNANEGELTRLRSTLVRRDTLAQVARGLDLGSYLTLGCGEIKTGGFRRDSILANTLEAVIAAVYLDAGLAACRVLVLRLIEPFLANLCAPEQSKDSKSRLQEYLQSRRLPLPVYTVLSVTGTEHDQVFQVECCLEALPAPAPGTGPTRRRAEQDAACRALDTLTTGLSSLNQRAKKPN
ncbi:RNase III [Gammaproteobacteria bacterium]